MSTSLYCLLSRGYLIVEVLDYSVLPLSDSRGTRLQRSSFLIVEVLDYSVLPCDSRGTRL